MLQAHARPKLPETATPWSTADTTPPENGRRGRKTQEFPRRRDAAPQVPAPDEYDSAKGKPSSINYQVRRARRQSAGQASAMQPIQRYPPSTFAPALTLYRTRGIFSAISFGCDSVVGRRKDNGRNLQPPSYIPVLGIRIAVERARQIAGGFNGLLPQDFYKRLHPWRSRAFRPRIRSNSRLRPDPEPEDLPSQRDAQHVSLLFRELRRHYLHPRR